MDFSTKWTCFKILYIYYKKKEYIYEENIRFKKKEYKEMVLGIAKTKG
jgi:hypothetical protein